MDHQYVWHASNYPAPDQAVIHRSLHCALAEVTAKWPDAAAVITPNKTYSFCELSRRVAGLAEELQELMPLSEPIALLQKVGLDSVAAWFACSLAGRPFLLLEPQNPQAHLLQLMEWCGCKTVLVDDTTQGLVPPSQTVVPLISDGRMRAWPQNIGGGAEDLAMIFPTSGSTGEPKLIAYASATLQVKVQSSIGLMEIPEQARVLIAGSHGNYGFLHHALVFLLSGNAVFLADVKAKGFETLIHAIEQHGVRHVRFTPSLFRKLAVAHNAQKALGRLHAVRFSGEPLLATDLKLARSVLNPACKIQNVFGSTESSLFIWKYGEPQGPENATSIPIGHVYPLSSYAIRPVDHEDGKGNRGELLICSKYQALGDYHKGFLDQQRFQSLEGRVEERVYATGDLVERLEDGSLLHLGRLDRMVKVRGNRVDLSEVEKVLKSLPGVTGAAVVAHAEADAPVLYGFITSDSAQRQSEQVRQELAGLLPNYMIPKTINILTQLPLMAGGKTDYQGLLGSIPKQNATEFAHGHSEASNALAEIWDSVLWKGAHLHDSDFFSLGGDSLGWMTLLNELEHHFNCDPLSNESLAPYTFKHLAEIFGEEKAAAPDIIEYGSLQVRLLYPSRLASRGIAMAMPGFRGANHAFPFFQAGLLENHDLWVAEMPQLEGDLQQKEQWWMAVRDAVQGIQAGVIPAPRVVFGFSVSGTIAWLVARLLAGPAWAPPFVLMVDAPPTHAQWRRNHRPLQKALKKAPQYTHSEILHIRRAPFAGRSLFRRHQPGWGKTDSIEAVMELPSVQHMDFIKSEVLSLARGTVSEFLNGAEIRFHWTTLSSPPNLFGFNLFYALHGEEAALHKILVERTSSPEAKNHAFLLAIATILCSISPEKKPEDAIQGALEKWPEHETLHFISRRLRRPVQFLFARDFPRIYPAEFTPFDAKRIELQHSSTRLAPRSIRLVYLGIDLIGAVMAARFNKYTRKY